MALNESCNLLQYVIWNESRIRFGETVRRNVGTRSRASQLPKGASGVVAGDGDIGARAHVRVDLDPLDNSSSGPPKYVGVMTRAGVPVQVRLHLRTRGAGNVRNNKRPVPEEQVPRDVVRHNESSVRSTFH